ncbi:MAG TPA: hypothetical protein VGQ24_04045, partial [Gemmatimonadales bacterium]|nr:hypothetical protein [Gemmatimonadales bacterium]
ETGIRRSVSPRLIVETLLLRWAMMDRIVDLEEVIQAGPRGRGAAGQLSAGKGERSTPTDVTLSAAKGPKPELEPASSPASPAAPRPRGPTASLASPALDAISVAWPAIVVAVRSYSRFLGEAFAATEPAELELPWLTVVMREPNPLFAERLLQEAGKVEEVLSRSLGQPVRLRVTAPSAAQETSPSKPRRMSESSLKAERLREFRSKDPALDTAADALDLEIVD